MTEAEENAFEAKAEKHFKSHRELPNGRDYRFNKSYSKKEDKKFKANFDAIFPNAPGNGI